MSLQIIHHPLIQHKLTLMRDVECSTSKFRTLAREIGAMLAYEATRDFPVETYDIQGWAGTVQGTRIHGKTVTLVPILRAGLGMLDGVLDLLPTAKVSVVGLYRDEETLQPVPYFEKLVGNLAARTALILDPMLATGGSLAATITLLKQKGCTDIRALLLVAAPQGVEKVTTLHPDVPLYTAALDDGLNENGYILPGLGDAGDRIFGTR